MTYHQQPKNESVGGFSTIWKQRTLLEKVLIIVYLIIGTAVIVAAVIFYLIFSQKLSDQKNLCLSPGCVNAAASILNRINHQAKPCDDFYEFACGNYMREMRETLPDDQLTTDTFSSISDRIELQLKTIVNEPINATESKAFKLAKLLNASCMNRTAVEATGLKRMNELLDSFGGWPVVKGNAWRGDQVDWIDTIGKMRSVGLATSYIVGMSIGANFKNSTMQTLRIDQPDLGLSRSFLLDDTDKTVKLYFDFMVDIAVIFGANRTNAEKELLETLEFEKKLANISTPDEERRDGESQYNPHTIKQLQVKYPFIRWLDYVNNVMPKELKVTDNEVIVVITPVYFERLRDVLAVTSKRTISNYLMWRSVLIASSFLSSEVRYRKIAYLAQQSEQKEQESSSPLWKECVSYTSSTLSVSVGALYVRRYFDEGVRERVFEMVENIRASFIAMLHDVAWMDEETKKKAIKKAEALIPHIAYPDELTDDKKIEEFYSDLEELKADEYLMNALRLNHFKVDYVFKRLRVANNKTDWVRHATPAVINAFYSAFENSIQFPAGILQGQFLAGDRPEYLNYGAIGQIIGHEITHAFDDQGRQFDEHGNLVDWWQPETKQKFIDRTKCIIEQYSKFVEPETNLTLNGILTQGENVADNGGVKGSYLAYRKWTQRHGTEKHLPGLSHYSPEQMFWISAAQTWCSVSRDWYVKVTIATDPHAVNRFRVLGSLQNNRQFAHDFHCAANTPMNPIHKCEIW